MLGYDLGLIEKVSSNVDIPVIASGEQGKLSTYDRSSKTSRCFCRCCCKYFHFTELTSAGAKAALQEAGIPVRKNYIGG